MPKVSVIIPVYNSGPYLERCFDSLARQSLQDIEAIVVVDEGTEDDSVLAVDSYTKKHKDLFRSFTMPHGGPGEARNYGLTFATGEFVAFVDSDDYVEREYCESPFRAAEGSGADIVCFSAYMIDEHRGTKRIIDPGIRPGMGPRQALLKATVMAWNKLYRRSFLDHCGIRFPSVFHEDLAEIPRLFANEPRIAVIDDILYDYIKRGDSSSGFSFGIHDLDVLPVCRLLLDHARKYPRYSAELEYIAILQLRGFLKDCSGRTEEWAREGLLEALAFVDSMRQARAENPYVLLEEAEEFGFGKTFSRLLAAIRKIIVRRLRRHYGLFLSLERLKFGNRAHFRLTRGRK